MPLEPPMANPGPMVPAQGARPGQPTMPVSTGMPPIAPVGGGNMPVAGNAGAPMHTQGPPGFVGNGMRHMGPGRAAHGMPTGPVPWGKGNF